MWVYLQNCHAVPLFSRLCSAHLKVSLISNEGASFRGVILSISVKRKTEFSQEICAINKVDFIAPVFIKFYNLVCARSSLGICTVICRGPDRNVLLLLSVSCHVERSIVSEQYEAWKSNLFLDLNLIILRKKVCLTYPQIVSPNRIARFFLSVCAVFLLVKSFPSLPLLLIFSM